jgi:hypothetical protein
MQRFITLLTTLIILAAVIPASAAPTALAAGVSTVTVSAE